jgi:hypothetical protein
VTQSVINHNENPDAPPDFKTMMREAMFRRIFGRDAQPA